MPLPETLAVAKTERLCLPARQVATPSHLRSDNENTVLTHPAFPADSRVEFAVYSAIKLVHKKRISLSASSTPHRGRRRDEMEAPAVPRRTPAEWAPSHRARSAGKTELSPKPAPPPSSARWRGCTFREANLEATCAEMAGDSQELDES